MGQKPKTNSMKTKIDIKSVILGALLGAVILLSVGAATIAGHHSTVSEYKALVSGGGSFLERDINKTAADGWEVVSTSSYGEQTLAVLRRPKN